MNSIVELMDLSGRTALVTGAGGKIGSVISETLCELGADVIMVDLPDSNIEEIADNLKIRWKNNVQSIYCDLEVQEQRDNLILTVRKQYDTLNILVNNAAFVGTSGLQGWSVPFEQQSVSTWSRAFEVNLTSVFDLCKGLSNILVASKGASIVNIGSIYGELGPDWSLYKDTTMGNPAAYSASKGGLIQLTRWLSTTLAPNVRVNTLSPGGVLRGQPKQFQKRYVERVPLKRMAIEDDFKGALAFLSTDLSKYLTGQNIIVDGGWSVW
jgi:NAD(P)-dependent dehydrogenase (short-subunit alcohol dehydrogenase family)